jgi:hypothetical protein
MVFCPVQILLKGEKIFNFFPFGPPFINTGQDLLNFCASGEEK